MLSIGERTTYGRKAKPLSDDDALYGAAFRAVMDRLPVHPENCSPDQLPVLAEITTKIQSWALDQDTGVRVAYCRAVADIMRTANDRAENVRRALRMNELYDALPKPPL